MGTEQIVLVLVGALAGGVVNGLTGFGTAITAMGLWLYALPPTVAASLAIISSVVSQFQTFHLIWRAIDWRRVMVFVIPGVFGVPLGTLLLPHIDPKYFKLGIGAFLIVYPSYILLRRTAMASAWGGQAADGTIGFVGGVLGGMTGLSGVFPVIWTDVRGWTKDQRRSVLQTFNVAILSLALVSHAVLGLLTREVGIAAMFGLPASIAGAWFGAFIYRRLGDHGYQRVVMILLLFSGVTLLWTSR
jgi:uncharacterized membrane protein YfcA